MTDIKLSIGQQEAYDLYKKNEKNIFISGCAGTGKSHIIQKIVNDILENNYKVAIVTPTGVASKNLKFDSISATTIDSFLFSDKQASQLNYLIIDEISMVTQSKFTKLNQMLKVIKNSSVSFGGVRIIISGDFFQLPPPDGKGFCFETNDWKELNPYTVNLTKVFRQDNKDFIDFLHSIRLGTQENKEYKYMKGMITNSRREDTVQLFLSNKMVKQYNDNKVTNFINNSDSQCYSSEIKITADPGISQEEIKQFIEKNESKRFLKEFYICVGLKVMITKNMRDIGLVNGDQGIIKGFEDNEILVEVNDEIYSIDRQEFEYKKKKFKICKTILTKGPRKGEECGRRNCKAINHTLFVYDNAVITDEDDQEDEDMDNLEDDYDKIDDNKKFVKILEDKDKPSISKLCISQYPLIYGYAYTVHKCQGLTLANLDLNIPIFYYHLSSIIYVGLSRSKTPEGVRILFETSKYNTHPYFNFRAIKPDVDVINFYNPDIKLEDKCRSCENIRSKYKFTNYIDWCDDCSHIEDWMWSNFSYDHFLRDNINSNMEKFIEKCLTKPETIKDKRFVSFVRENFQFSE